MSTQYVKLYKDATGKVIHVQNNTTPSGRALDDPQYTVEELELEVDDEVEFVTPREILSDIDGGRARVDANLPNLKTREARRWTLRKPK